MQKKVPLIFLFTLTFASAFFNGNCFDIETGSSNFVRGQTSPFNITYFSLLKSRENTLTTLDFSNIPGTTYSCPTISEFTYSGNFTKKIICDVTIPESARIKEYVGILNVTSDDCPSADIVSFIFTVLEGNELWVTSIPEEVESEKGEIQRFSVTVENRVPYQMDIEFYVDKLSSSRYTVSESTFTLNESQRVVFVDVNTSTMSYGTHNITFNVASPSQKNSTDVTLTVVPSQTIVKFQFEEKNRISELKDKVSLYYTQGRFSKMDYDFLNDKLDEATTLVESTKISSARELIDQVNISVINAPEAKVNTEVLPELDDDINFDTVEVPLISQIKFYLPIILIISIIIVIVAVIPPLRKAFLSNVEVGKITEKVSEREFVVRLRVKNNSLSKISEVTIADEVPAGFKLKGAFKMGDEEIRSSKAKGKSGTTIYSVPLGDMETKNEIVVRYVLEKPGKTTGVIELPKFALRYIFRGKEEILKSNKPIL